VGRPFDDGFPHRETGSGNAMAGITQGLLESVRLRAHEAILGARAVIASSLQLRYSRNKG
jgi:hypothetical protein